MSTLAELQRAFSRHVAGVPGAAPPPGVLGDANAGPAERMAIYADGMRLRFHEVLAIEFPGVHALLGDEAFEALAREYGASHPSAHPSIRWYGRALPGFLSGAAPWRERPLLGEMARFEWCKSELLDAVDDAVLAVEAVARIAPEDWGAMRPRRVRASARVSLAWNVPVLYRAILEDRPLPEPEHTAAGVEWLLWRKDITLAWRSLAADEARALDVCDAGGSFAELCEALCETGGESRAPMRAATLLKRWLVDGLLRAV